MSRAALRAGKKPNTTPTSALNPTDTSRRADLVLNALGLTAAVSNAILG
jgi:hypothetical protein